MKIYTPKRLLRKAIKATQASLDDKWKLENKGLGVVAIGCALCTFDDEHGYNSCSICPYNQYTNGIVCGIEGATYLEWARHKSATNFMTVRRELQRTLRWLKKQLPVKSRQP